MLPPYLIIWRLHAAIAPRPLLRLCACVRATLHHEHADQYRKAIQALTSEGLSPPTSEILDEMLTKHPQSPPTTIPSSPAPPPLKICEESIIRALRSFPGDSAPGPSLLRANHFKEAIFCPSPDIGNKALKALTIAVNQLIEGLAPPPVVPHLCGATLLAIKKKGGGHCPIAVGEVLRRLTSKCLSRPMPSMSSPPYNLEWV